MKAKNLKLIAKTEEDIKVVSALSNSIASTANIANLKNKILMQLNRSWGRC